MATFHDALFGLFTGIPVLALYMQMSWQRAMTACTRQTNNGHYRDLDFSVYNLMHC